jgi:hypothetical protein
MFDLKEKQKCLITNIMERKNSIGIFPTGYGKSVCFQMVSRCNLRWKAYWFGNFTTEEPYDCYGFHSIKNFRNCAKKILRRFFANFCHEIGCENDQTYIFRFVRYLSTFFYTAIYFSIAKVNIRFIHTQPYLGSISNVFHHKVQCI